MVDELDLPAHDQGAEVPPPEHSLERAGANRIAPSVSPVDLSWPLMAVRLGDRVNADTRSVPATQAMSDATQKGIRRAVTRTAPPATASRFTRTISSRLYESAQYSAHA